MMKSMATRKGRRVALLVGVSAVAILSLAAYLSWPHLRLLYLFEPLGANAQGFKEYRHRQMGIVMVRLPGGTFSMGAQAKDPKGMNYDPEAQKSEGPVHEVTLSPFLIGVGSGNSDTPNSGNSVTPHRRRRPRR